MHVSHYPPLQGDTPVAGFYTTRLVRGAIDVPCMVWFGQPVIDGERQDRSPRWCIAIDGRSDRFDKEQQCRIPLEAADRWPLGKRITAREYAFLTRRAKWARDHAPEHPAANPRQPIDLGALPPRF